ncbi:hypothetical protein [Pseudomonas sp. EA_65y_Pfl2_P78]|uniref:hypothetical protein n=1 Tax=Pseudomonas sp. EA_65y_Pfl2_P78 TaxID=3088695 RepID=UPI0030D91ACE
MKGTFSSYDPKTGKGIITPTRSGSSFAAATGFFLADKGYKFSIALMDEHREKIKVGDPVEFDEPKTAGGEATNLRINPDRPLK